MKRAKFNVLISLVAIAFIAIVTIGNVFRVSVPVATVEGSYASEFAKKKHLKEIELADSQKKYFDQRYEVFDYNINMDGTIILQSYKGVSTSLVIPKSINGRNVTSIGEEFFDKATFIKEVYIPASVREIKGEPTKNVRLYCNKDSAFINNIDNDLWDVESLYDSEYVDFFRGDIPFEYNENGSSVEITSYTGNDKIIVIPSYIDGKAVTEVSMDLIGKYDAVVFPETVKSITGHVYATLYTGKFAIELTMSIIAFIIVIVIVNIVLPRYGVDSSDEYVLSTPQLILAAGYLVLQIAFALLVIYTSIINAYIALIISVAIMIAYIALNSVSGTGRTHAMAVEEKISSKTSWMKTFKVMTADLADNITDKEAKKIVNRLVENIKYSDSCTGDELADIENKLYLQVESLRDAIESQDTEAIIAATNIVQATLNKRNMICRQMKR